MTEEEKHIIEMVEQDDDRTKDIDINQLQFYGMPVKYMGRECLYALIKHLVAETGYYRDLYFDDLLARLD